MVCWAFPNASGVHFSEVRVFTEPPSSYPFFIGFPPGSLGNGYHTRQYAGSDPAGQDHRSPFVVNLRFLTVLQAPFLCIYGIDKQPLRKCLTQPVHIIHCGMHAGHVVRTNDLQGKFLRFLPKGTLPFCDIFGDSGDLFRAFSCRKAACEKISIFPEGVGRGCLPDPSGNLRMQFPVLLPGLSILPGWIFQMHQDRECGGSAPL
jgi:hypothetical protein